MTDEQLKRGLILVAQAITAIYLLGSNADDGGYHYCPVCFRRDGSHADECSHWLVKQWLNEVLEKPKDAIP